VLTFFCLDNAPFHHGANLEEILGPHGVVLLYLPAYSPEFNPIEMVFSQVKKRLEADELYFKHLPLIHRVFLAFEEITPTMVTNMINHSGYSAAEED
jgi:transposase